MCGLKFRAAVVHENTPFVVPHLRDVLGSVRSVPQEPWTLIYLAKFRPSLSFPFLSCPFSCSSVLQNFCSFPFMFCSPSRPHCVQKLWWGLCCLLPASCLLRLLDLGMTLVRVSLLQGLFLVQRLRPIELDHFFSFRWNKWFFNLGYVCFERLLASACLGVHLYLEGEGIKF